MRDLVRGGVIQGVRTARLPIGDLMQRTSSQVLTVNQVSTSCSVNVAWQPDI